MSGMVKVDIKQLPHAEGLALPAYQSVDAAGLDLLAGVPPGVMPHPRVTAGAMPRSPGLPR